MAENAIRVPKKVLIVEDEPPLLDILVKKIQQLGCEVVTAEDGDEALRKIVSDKPDLVLLDIIIPRRNGFDVLQTIRTKYKMDIPVIVVTNLEMKEDKETAINLHIVDYVIKSNTSLRRLMSLISRTLNL